MILPEKREEDDGRMGEGVNRETIVHSRVAQPSLKGKKERKGKWIREDGGHGKRMNRYEGVEEDWRMGGKEDGRIR
jgi:hypothetical protein